jgi:GMP synthase-like glutamine amidotransferase
MMKKDAKLALIDNSIDSSIYTPEEHWKPYLTIEWDSFKATHNQFPDLSKGQYSHVLLTGSEASILEREEWVDAEVEVVHKAIEEGIPILGSCYGHQLLAFALSGPSSVRRSTHPEVGWISIQTKECSELLGESRQAYSFSIHFDEVVNDNENFHILAYSEHCQVQACQWKSKLVWGIQIHPEIDVPHARVLLKNLISLKLKTTPIYEEALKSTPKDSGLIKHIVQGFLSS